MNPSNGRLEQAPQEVAFLLSRARPALGLVLLPLLLALLAMLAACNRSDGSPARRELTPQMHSYWFAGKAELNRYTLKQARYGELHSGHAVLIYVTEEFLPDKQVKYEHGDHPNRIPVLKLNATSKFLTGIYPYSVMTSVFTPVDDLGFPRTLKVSFSAQEWCGHVFGQLNLRGDRYRSRSFSYFQSEGDRDQRLSAAVLEDELWVRLRLAPERIATGEQKIVPGHQFLRLRHKELRAYAARVRRTSAGTTGTLEVEYPELKRTLRIEYKRAFPHDILGWQDTHVSGWGPTEKVLTTTARRTHVTHLDYWSRHANRDRPLRRRLGL